MAARKAHQPTAWRRQCLDGTAGQRPGRRRIYEACTYFTLFQKTPFKGKCAVVTSYNPMAKDVTLEETGANTETDMG